MTQTVGLVAIVKDEADVIQACLDSIRPHISYWTIVDTGSTDGTQRLVRAALDDVPGELYEREWRDFGTNRTEALALAKDTADYLLMPDADQILVTQDELPALTADAYLLPILGFPKEYRLPKLTRGDLDWRYEGVVHEYLTGNGYPAKLAPPLDAWAIYTHHPPERMNGKGERYIALMEADLKTNPGNPRTMFYLAQTYDELGNVDRAIYWYRQRIAAGGWEEETFYARYRLGCLLCVHVSFSEGERELMAAWRMRPSRIEPLRALANAATDVANKAACPPDVLFVHRDMYAAV